MTINGDWITSELLEKILWADEGSAECRFKVLGHKAGAATKKGDNYASEMYRVEIEYEMHGKLCSCTKILKVMPSGEIQRKVMEKNNIFPREIAVYRDVLPRIKKFLQGIGDPVQISPACTYTTDDPKTMLVFEDIKECGYQMVDRRIGLDFEQSKAVLRKLAKLHACSAIVYQEDPAVMEPVMEGAISTNPNRQDFLIFYKLCARQVAKLVENWKDPSYEEILAKLRILPDTIIAKGCQVYTRDDSIFNVLNHDDVWISNLMFKYDDKVTLSDVLLFDYQLAYFGSPGVDLNFFLNGSVKDEIREKHCLELIRFYHTVLTETLRKLNYSGNSPTLQDIHVEIVRTGFHGVNAVLCLLPLAMMENSENAEMDVFLQENKAGEAFREQIFSNPRYEPILRSALSRFDLLGYFD